MFWMERVVPLLVTLFSYAAYFKLAGRLEAELERWINPQRALYTVLWFGWIAISVVRLAAMLTGIVCSTGLVLVILFAGMPLLGALLCVVLGCSAFALQCAIDRVSEALDQHQEQAQADALWAWLERI